MTAGRGRCFRVQHEESGGVQEPGWKVELDRVMVSCPLSPSRGKKLIFGKGSVGSLQRGRPDVRKRDIIQKHHAHIDIVDFLYILS